MRYLYILTTLAVFLAGCVQTDSGERAKPQVIATTSIIADIVRNIGGDFVEVNTLMGANVDPHQYKASERDVLRIADADVIFHNGLNLESKLGKVLLKAQGAVPSFTVTTQIPINQLIMEKGVIDPHVWLDPSLWVHAVSAVTDGLVEVDPANSLYYRRNEETYISELLLLDARLREKLNSVPLEKRVLVTSHYAFAYFGKAYEWDVVGVQGINTSAETSVYSIQELAKSIVIGRIRCIFAENSISSRSIEALTASVNAMDGKLNVGATLYSDSLGGPDSGAESYMDMLSYNVDAIVKGIMGGN